MVGTESASALGPILLSHLIVPFIVSAHVVGCSYQTLTSLNRTAKLEVGGISVPMLSVKQVSWLISSWGFSNAVAWRLSLVYVLYFSAKAIMTFLYIHALNIMPWAKFAEQDLFIMKSFAWFAFFDVGAMIVLSACYAVERQAEKQRGAND